MARRDLPLNEREFRDVQNLTDNTGGTVDQTLQDVAGLTISSSYSQSEVQALRDATANNLADINAKLTTILNRLNQGN